MTRRSILTVLAAVLGLALSAALAWSASQLAGQRIGLASEPLAVTQGLAPHHRAATSPKTVHTDHETVSTRPAPPIKPTASTSSPQIFSTSTAAPAPVTPAAPAPAPAPAAPAAVRTTAASSSTASSSQSSSGASQHRDDHHPDD